MSRKNKKDCSKYGTVLGEVSMLKAFLVSEAMYSATHHFWYVLYVVWGRVDFIYWKEVKLLNLNHTNVSVTEM